MLYRYFIKLAFDGSRFSGWQLQPNAETVQAVLDDALFKLLKTNQGVTGCGRTDAGVHAKVFFAHFDVNKPIADPVQFVHKLNRFLPSEIAILTIQPVVPTAHARFSASWREYHYFLLTRKDPFLDAIAYKVGYNLDVNRMNQAGEILIEHSDFECFSKVRTQVANFRCKLFLAEWSKTENGLVFVIRADRFLRNMVRAIVGTMIDIGRNKISLQDLETILKSRNRSLAGQSVPAKGLFLWDVSYPEELFIEEPLPFTEESLLESITREKQGNDTE